MRDAPDAERIQFNHKQCAALPVRKAFTIAPEGEFIKDFIVLFFLFLPEHLCAFFICQLIEIRTVLVIGAKDSQMMFIQHGHGMHGKREGEGRECFAALEIQAVIMRGRIAVLLLFLFFVAACSREKKMTAVEPDERGFLAQTRQLTEFTIIEVKEGTIAIRFLVGLGKDKGCL